MLHTHVTQPLAAAEGKTKLTQRCMKGKRRKMMSRISMVVYIFTAALVMGYRFPSRALSNLHTAKRLHGKDEVHICTDETQLRNVTVMPTSSPAHRTSSQWDFEENEAAYFDDYDDVEAENERSALEDDVRNKGVQWDFEEDVNYFDEEFEEGVEYYESPLVATSSLSPLVHPNYGGATDSDEVKREIKDIETGREGIANPSNAEDADVEYTEIMGIKIPKRKLGCSEEDMKYKGEFGNIEHMTTGWEGFSEEAPYYDDNFLMDEEEVGYNHLRMTQKETLIKAEQDNRNIDDEKYVVRDMNGVIMGWSDWNENAASYFDEDHGNDDELTFGEKLVLERKAKELDQEDQNSMQALISKSTKHVDRENFKFPEFKGVVTGEFEEWDNEEFMGAESDFGPED